jgi:23S rRNA (uracil1939-C5)-methyltransferase
MEMGEQIELVITDTGTLGDGIGRYHNVPVYVPLAMEGDKVRAAIAYKDKQSAHARLLDIISPSPQRQAPVCDYFGVCGGCSMQHLSEQYYHRLKEKTALRVLKALNLPDTIMEPLIEVGAYSRRRVDWSVQVMKGEISIGFQSSKSHDIVPINECPVCVPALNDVIIPLKTCLQEMKKPGVITSVNATALQDGIDMLIQVRSPVKTTDKDKLKAFALAYPLLRLALRDTTTDTTDIVYQQADAQIMFGEIAVTLPVAAFLQASESAQLSMTNMVVKHLHGCAQVIDLYAGCGTYSFPLAMQSRYVFAYEGAPDMVAAIQNAVNAHRLSDTMAVACRDLFTHPLTAEEMQHCDGVVINPPRNGALPQIKQIASSRLSKVVMVSCNPATFTRDAAYLLKNGYTLYSLIPVDQFVWSSHLEIIGLFERTI